MKDLNLGRGRFKYIGKSDKYKYVYISKSFDGIMYTGKVGKKKRMFKDEREAARWVDLALIDAGKEPVNVLKRKVKDD